MILSKGLSSSDHTISHADIPLTGSFTLINTALNVIKVPLSKLNLISEADSHLKELHFCHVMGKLELRPSHSRVSEVLCPSSPAKHIMNHCVLAFIIPVGAFVGPCVVCCANTQYSLLPLN